MFGNKKIQNWKEFNKYVRKSGSKLLIRLDEFPNSILVTGCQRSGTTLLSRVITESEGMFNYWFGKDDELDAALILAGIVDHTSRGRYCFQTTYLNECYKEYFHYLSGHKIIWMLRNPYSVVYSMLHNWRRFALNDLFMGCGVQLLDEKELIRYRRLGYIGVSSLKRACYSYVGKTIQAFELKKNSSKGNILIIDYDELVTNKHEVLPEVYKFIELNYRQKYAQRIHSKSVLKADKLTKKERKTVDSICLPIYKKANMELVKGMS